MEQKVEAEEEKNMQWLTFVPSAVSEPRWALHRCDNQRGAKGFQFFEIAACVS